MSSSCAIYNNSDVTAVATLSGGGIAKVMDPLGILEFLPGSIDRMKIATTARRAMMVSRNVFGSDRLNPPIFDAKQIETTWSNFLSRLRGFTLDPRSIKYLEVIEKDNMIELIPTKRLGKYEWQSLPDAIVKVDSRKFGRGYDNSLEVAIRRCA